MVCLKELFPVLTNEPVVHQITTSEPVCYYFREYVAVIVLDCHQLAADPDEKLLYHVVHVSMLIVDQFFVKVFGICLSFFIEYMSELGVVES